MRKLRVKMRVDIAALQRRLGTTMLYVTHDQVEAMTMGQRVAALRDGRLQQVGPPRELYTRPENLFVAGFIGSPAMNQVRATLIGDGRAHVHGIEVANPREAADAAGAAGLREVIVGLRPESLELSDPAAADGDPGAIVAEVEVVEELGADAFAFFVPRNGARPEAGGGEPADDTRLIARTDWRRPPERGQRVALRPRAGEAHVFDPDSGTRLG